MMQRPRTARDPAAPKAATSAQQYYVKSRREALKLQTPDLSSADLQKALADEWRDLSDDKRAPHIAKAKGDKERHQSELSTYVPDPSHLKPTKGGKRLQKDPLRPKKPKSAYLYFGEATRAELTSSNPGIRINMLSKLIGEEWQKLTPDEKAPYVAQAEADQERYRLEMLDYEPSAEYVAALAAFKVYAKNGSLKDVEDDDDDDELKEECESLKRQVKELEGTVKEQAKTIAKFEKAAEKAEARAAKAAPKEKSVKEKSVKEKSEPPAKKAKTGDEPQKEKLVVIQDAAHFLAWTKKILGSKAEKADGEILAAFEAKGNPGVVKLLARRYKAEHK